MSLFHSPLRRRLLAALAIGATVAGCGFQLRGPLPMPFDTIYLGVGEFSNIKAALQRRIEANGHTKVMDDPAKAEVHLDVLLDKQSKEISAINASGRVSEYHLTRDYVFRLMGKDGRLWIPRAEVKVQRTLPFNDSDVLAKDQEEALLRSDMEADVVRQIMWRLSSAKAPAQR